MSLIFETIQTDGIAALSYLLGDESAGTAAVIDPRVDVAVYLELARARQVAISHIFETHNHADFVSGARELQHYAPQARIYLSHEGAVQYQYDHQPLRDGDSFEFGSLRLQARHTPGHTREHMAFLAATEDQPDTPWGVFSGDSLFVNSAGRPDLMGAAHTGQLTAALFRTLTDFYLKLDDHVILFPGHGAGSACGANIGDRAQSSIGYERRFNPFLQYQALDAFAAFVSDSAPPEPTYYQRTKKLNARGPQILADRPLLPGLPPSAFRERLNQGDALLVDTRSMLAFGGGHIPGALNIGARPLLSVWAGWLLDPQPPLLLVMEKDSDLVDLLPLFWRTGYTNFAGYLAGGMTAWGNAGYDLDHLRQLSIHQLKRAGDEMQIMDVRSPQEWQAGHIPGARHLFLPELNDNYEKFDKQRPLVVYCGSGYRASIAASALKQQGFQRVYNLPGSWQAWQNAGFPVAREEA